MKEKAIAPDPDIYAVTEGFAPDDWQSETTSIGSSLYRGCYENGRRYQTLREVSYVPSDDQQFEAYEAGHITALNMDSNRENPLFRSPVGKHIKHVLDIGTGKGSWAVDVADLFQKATVRGVDLFPPPINWMPPNCVLEVDDILQPWTWQQPFDLIHMRNLDAAFTPEENARLYQQCYNNLQPGGWIEQLEISHKFHSEDNSWPEHCHVKDWERLMTSAAAKSGRPLDLYHRFPSLIKQTGFVDIHVEEAKWPVGPWPRDKQLKEAGSVNLGHWLTGMEGYAMYLFTKYGSPTAWSKEEVQVHLARVRKELVDPRYHLYHTVKRVWARKPMPEEDLIKIEVE
ncbi:hypothetical protein N7508_004864 [Penicillium antarcticum]|nr:uncharacterized protein N7508_004864 [Penicillium antarcticum]KAJ5305849.1 hypothetical protein N7508_004864 [Penicillium antarcticum]